MRMTMLLTHAVAHSAAAAAGMKMVLGVGGHCMHSGYLQSA